MILKAKHHFIIYPFFIWYGNWLIRRKFSKVSLSGDFIDRKLPVLMVANHVSWWDGFWALYLNINSFSRRFYFMMQEDRLRKYWYFNHCGGYSVNKKSRSILTSLEYSRELLKDPSNLVLIFPQGKIQSMHQQNIHFEKGIGKITEGMEGKIHLVMVVFLTDYFSSSKPGLFIYLREYKNGKFDREALEKAYQNFYDACLKQQTNRGE